MMHRPRTRNSLAAFAIMPLLLGACASSTVIDEQRPLTGDAAVDPAAEPQAATAPPTAEPTTAPPAQPTATAVPAPVSREFKSGAQVMLQTPERFEGLRVGLIANQASQVNGRSLIDLMHEEPAINLVAVFAPEHGVRGNLGAGEQVPDGIDPATGVTVHSLYGATRSPTDEMLADIDVLFYDLQDVGTRYYTYISTMGFAMQAAAANDVAFVVLDRPMIRQSVASSGFTRDEDQFSFVSAFEIPTTYSLTAAELALAIKHHPLIPGLEALPVSVFPVAGWQPGDTWPDAQIWIPPSPGLPTLASAQTYPATVLFEATAMSYGRGTDQPFGAVGAPWLDAEVLADDLNAQGLGGVRFEATTLSPVAQPTASNPQFEGQTVPAVRLIVEQPASFAATETGVHLLAAVKLQADEQQIELIERPDFFDLLAGTARLRTQLEADVTADAIIASWQEEAQAFDDVMGPWKLYPRPLN